MASAFQRMRDASFSSIARSPSKRGWSSTGTVLTYGVTSSGDQPVRGRRARIASWSRMKRARAGPSRSTSARNASRHSAVSCGSTSLPSAGARKRVGLWSVTAAIYYGNCPNSAVRRRGGGEQRLQGAAVHRLDGMAVKARGGASRAFLVLHPAAERDHLRAARGILLAQPPRHLKAVHDGHAEVEEDERRRAPVEALQRGDAVI